MGERMAVVHHCDTPHQIRRRAWTCPYCRRLWEPEGDTTWRHETAGVEGEVVGFVMRYPDGTTQTFGKSS